jgi:hypothetical protein
MLSALTRRPVSTLSRRSISVQVMLLPSLGANPDCHFPVPPARLSRGKEGRDPATLPPRWSWEVRPWIRRWVLQRVAHKPFDNDQIIDSSQSSPQQSRGVQEGCVRSAAVMIALAHIHQREILFQCQERPAAWSQAHR